MRTLYVSDLDGTLLHSEATLSEYTCRTINALAEKGMLFSYATARSYVTASKVTIGIQAKIPLIVYNGAFVVDNATGGILLSNYFGSEAKQLLQDMIRNDLYPIVYSFLDGKERFSYVKSKCTRGMERFLATRAGDRRCNAVKQTGELFSGEIFYFTLIDEENRLEKFYQKYRTAFHTVYERDIYSGDQWLEFMPKTASKSHAAMQLKKMLNCDRLVVFGDGSNDLDLFGIADECYAVQNANEELKKIASGIIGSNDEDGVAKWLQSNVFI